MLTAVALEEMGRFGRYLDVDGDGIPYRTYPGTHPTKGAFFTRGTSRDEWAAYTEDGAAYKRNMDRLLRKWDTAKQLVPPPQLYQQEEGSELGMIFFGTSTYSAEEARDLLMKEGMFLDALRLKAFPFGASVAAFIAAHHTVFIIEQNRDAQLRSLLLLELQLPPEKLVPVLNYDGMPITADAIASQIAHYLSNAKPQQHDVSETHI